jgi:ABC-type multidrug transport system fused ATPase/permease subunit
VKKAAEIAQLMDYITTTDQGFQTAVTQGGSNLSGGQKQRISIARALARKPEIYIFDDSFSAIDFKTDAALRKALKQNLGDATVLIVAQRINTVMNADQIIVLEKGRVVGKGIHKDLMENCQVYRELALSQLSRRNCCHERAGKVNQNQRQLGQRPMGGRMGGPHGMAVPGEKARNFKATMLTLAKYLKPYRISLIIALFLAIVGTAFTIIGPRLLGDATTRLFEGRSGRL